MNWGWDILNIHLSHHNYLKLHPVFSAGHVITVHYVHPQEMSFM